MKTRFDFSEKSDYENYLRGYEDGKSFSDKQYRAEINRLTFELDKSRDSHQNVLHQEREYSRVTTDDLLRVQKNLLTAEKEIGELKEKIDGLTSYRIYQEQKDKLIAQESIIVKMEEAVKNEIPCLCPMFGSFEQKCSRCEALTALKEHRSKND